MSYKDLVELADDNYTENGLVDNLFLDLCSAKTETDIRGRLVNISVIIPDKEGETTSNSKQIF